MSYEPKCILDIIGLLYDAVTATELWPKFAHNLSQVIPCTSSTLHTVETLTGNLTFNYISFNADKYLEYQDHHHRIDPFFKRTSQLHCAGFILRSEEVILDSELVKTELYQDFLRPQNLFSILNSCISIDKTLSAHLSLSRPQTMGYFRKEEVNLLRLLLPHLQRALRLHHLFSTQEMRERMLMDALDRLPQGVLIVSNTSRIIYINHSAKKIIDRRDGLSVSKHGLLEASYMNEIGSLRRFIKTACDPKSNPGLACGGVLQLSRSSDLRPLSIMVAPLSERTLAPVLQNLAALVFISDPETHVETAEEVIRRLYGLTAAEARLATVLIQGNNVSQASKELGVTPNTVRTHIKHIFRKTGVKRQSDLIKLLLNSPATVK